MRRCICVIVSFWVLAFLGKSKGIITSNEERPKPSYTSGIKTAHWKNPNAIQTHHNYSKVYANNPDGHSQYVITQEEKTQKIYPVYNAHAYGSDSQRQEVNSQSGHGHDSNRTIYKRKIHYKTVDVYEKCPEGATGQFVYSLSCNQFLNCWKGRGQPQNCSPGTLFNPKTLECDYPDKVECITGPRQNTLEGQRSQKSITQVLCPKEFTGLIPNYTDCSKFINCNNGQSYPSDCPPGTLFDIDRNVCDFPYKATCFVSSPQYQQNQQLGQTPPYSYGSHQYGSAIQGQRVSSQYQGTVQSQSGYSPHSSHQYGAAVQGQRVSSQYGTNAMQQGQPGYGSAVQDQHVSSQYGQRGSAHYASTLNQGQHNNVDSKLDFGQDQQTASSNALYSQTGSAYSATTVCNPRVQNCGSTQGERCDPQTRNCNLNVGQGQGQISGSTRTNYNRVCNVNDPHCRGDNQNNEQPKCPDGYQGLTKHPTDCAKFLNCANGQTFVQSCAPGTLFSPTLGVCDFPYRVQCTVTQRATTAPSQGHGAYSQGQNRGRDRHDQGHRQDQSQDGYNQGQSYNYGAYNLTPRPPGHVTIVSTLRDIDRGQIGVVSRPDTGKSNDYEDVVEPNGRLTYAYHSTSPRSVWPPPFPSTDVNADYVFEYEDGEPVTLDPDNVFVADKETRTSCDRRDFYCTRISCVSNTLVCDGHRDCENGKDEKYCDEHLDRFAAIKNRRLDVLEKQRWMNVTYTTCAYLCIESLQFNCRSFNYRKTDKVCYLTDSNVGLSGALRIDHPYDYYELKRTSINCTGVNAYKCQNGKCITRGELCDGVDDCGNRQDERGCKPEDFGYSMRLAGATDNNEGRVEITAFGRTGYICDDRFGILDANVVCRELGFHMGAAEFKGNSYYLKDMNENKTTVYMMDDLECIGNETTLLDCGFSGWGVHNCREGEIAGVTCKTPQEKCGAGYWKCDSSNECVPISFVCDGLYDCTDSSDEGVQHCEAPTEMRLVNGSSKREGRIEIKHHGIWGTVCDDDFNEDAAKVACKYFGYNGATVVKKDAYFGRGEGPIWLDQVSCYGNETELNKCTHWDWGEHNCDHSEDVGVICSTHHDVVAVQRNSKHSHSTATKPPPTSCGFRKDNQFAENDLIHARVVSGSVAKRGDYPWQAALRVKGKGKAVHWCGAVVISSRWVLTAAHCLQGYAKGAYIVVAGEYNTDEDEGTEQEKYIEEYFVHEDFRKGHKMNNDIALIKLKAGGFSLNDDVQPICLPDADADYERELNCTVSGFGSVKSGTSAYSHDMRSAWIPIHDAETCGMPHVYGTAITEGMICAGFLDGGVDACDGDSGGPLACLDNGLFTLYGVTSWGQHCGYANKPGVYVKIGHYRRWIDDVISRRD